jgi:hypothetical protein
MKIIAYENGTNRPTDKRANTEAPGFCGNPRKFKKKTVETAAARADSHIPALSPKAIRALRPATT